MGNLIAQLTLAWAGGVVLASMSVVGVLEWAKGFFVTKAGDNLVPPWGWRIIMAAAAFIIAVSLGGGVNWIATNTGALIAMTQLGYPLLIQLPEAMIKAARRKLEQ